MQRNLLIVGASRGIGNEVAKFFDSQGDHIFSVSRTPSDHGNWIEAEISNPEGIGKVVSSVANTPIAALLFTGGVWEQGAFTDDYEFRESSHRETQTVINVNLVAPIEITKGLVDNLKRTNNPRAIYMGATSGLERSDCREVAYSASKFGLRGAIHALRLELQKHGVSFTSINPGYVATPEVLEDIRQGGLSDLAPIPMEDIIRTIDWILSTSNIVETGDLSLTHKPKSQQRRRS